MGHFQYITLQPQQIRVLELEPGTDGDSLVGNIRHQALSPEDNEIPKFEALSYTWGNPSRPQSVSLRNDALPGERVSASGRTILDIGDNLAAALCALRLPTEKRILWCDQICINQADLEERGRQVQRMADIYCYADRVVVWLGPEASWSTMAMETMRWASDQVESMAFDSNYHGYLIKYKTSSDKRVSETVDPLPLSTAQWLAVEQLVALAWHKRLWTYQEIVLADEKTCIVKLGKEEMLWSEFTKGLHLAAITKPTPPHCFVDESTFSFNINLIFGKFAASFWDLRGEKEADWFGLLGLTRQYECSDVRDKLFAIQGLMIPDIAQSLKPDYTKTAKEILTYIGLDHIGRNKDIGFLSECNAAASPSWVPDLERPTSSLSVDIHATPYSQVSAYLVEPGILEVAGIKGAVLLDDPVPLVCKLPAQTDTDYWQQIIAFLRNFVSGEEYQSDSFLDKFIMMLTYGCVRDYNIQRIQTITPDTLHSLQEWRWKIRRWLNDTGDEVQGLTDYWMTDRQFISKIPIGNTAIGCAKTCDGDFVRVPLESRSGDIVAVLLGSRNPIVLRPQSPNGYIVIGPCYHPGLAQGVALLGIDFKGWEPLYERTRGLDSFYKEGEDLRRSDPRLNDVPLPDGHEQGMTEGGWLCWAAPGSLFTKFDPRMSEEELKKRGVPIRKYRLL